MTFVTRLLAACLVLGSLAPPSTAQRRDRDPLTDAEVDQMREAADYPSKRLELLVKFNRERMFNIESAAAEGPSKTKEVHDILQDFIAIMDEIDDNIEMYGSHAADMRKGLKLVIEADRKNPAGTVGAILLHSCQCE
jgi:hypothetical protein